MPTRQVWAFHLCLQDFRTLVLEMPYSTNAYINAHINGDAAEGEKPYDLSARFLMQKKNQWIFKSIARSEPAIS
ncbi:MAG: hypothetical protein IPN33_26130 [Saprospiraceae bacterium]|nr:hypothetical protein [Saprospiraceae bacterium]